MSKFITLRNLSRFLDKIKGIFVKAATNTTKGHVVTFGDDGKTIIDSGFEIKSSVPANADFTNTTYEAATTTKDGLLTSTDKTKIDGIAEGAQANVLESVKVNGTAVPIADKAVNIDLSSYAKTSALSSYAIKESLDDYAKKSDLTNVYTYKGTVNTYAELPTSGLTEGWVYNIETADDTHNIKAGDNVAWNGTSWDNLSGLLELDIQEVTESEIDALFA